MADSDLVRILIPDTEAVFEGETLFSDTDIENFLLVSRGNIYRAAGLAMVAIGNSEAMISKVIRTQDLSTNGAAVAASFHKAAELMFKRADDDDKAADMGYFEIIDFGEGWGHDRPELTNWRGNYGW